MTFTAGQPEDLSTGLDTAADALTGAARGLRRADRPGSAFAAGHPGVPGLLGHALAARWAATLDTRVAELEAAAARASAAADAVRAGHRAYADTDDAVRRTFTGRDPAAQHTYADRDPTVQRPSADVDPAAGRRLDGWSAGPLGGSASHQDGGGGAGGPAGRSL